MDMHLFSITQVGAIFVQYQFVMRFRPGHKGFNFEIDIQHNPNNMLHLLRCTMCTCLLTLTNTIKFYYTVAIARIMPMPLTY